MPNTYTQLHHQFVFATKFRDASIQPSWKNELHKFITALVQHRDHKMLQINTMPDHLHMLIGMRPVQSISSLIQIVKSESCVWIKKNGLARGFAWQDGYGAFSYSKNQLHDVAMYIKHQEEHHQNIKFIPEYINMLNEADIRYDEKYIFHEPLHTHAVP